MLPNMGYKPPNRVWFLRVRILKLGIIFDRLVSQVVNSNPGKTREIAAFVMTSANS